MSEGPALHFDGERFVPECQREICYEHWHRYAFASQFAADLKVLDAACGEGYGAYLLAGSAAEVVGVDLSEEAVAHAMACLLYTSPSPRDGLLSRMPSSA